MGGLDHTVPAEEVIAGEVRRRTRQVVCRPAEAAQDAGEGIGLAQEVVVPLLELVDRHPLRADQDVRPVEQGPVVVHGHVRLRRAERPRQEIVPGDRVLEGAGAGIGLDDVGHDEVDPGAVNEFERPVEARGIVPVQPEDERPHDVDPGIVHARHHLAHGRGVVGPLIEAVDRRLADRLDAQEGIAAAAVVGRLQERGLLGEVDGQLGGPGAAERTDRVAQRLEGAGGVVQIVVPEEELPAESGPHAGDQAVAVDGAENGQLDEGLEQRVVQARWQRIDRLLGVARSLALNLVRDIRHVAVPDRRSVGQEHGAEVAVELAAAREGRGGDDLLGAAPQSLPDPHVESKRAAIPDPIEGRPVQRPHGPPRLDVVEKCRGRPLPFPGDHGVDVPATSPFLRDGRGVRSAEDDGEGLAGGRPGAARLARPAVGLARRVGVGRDEQDVVVSSIQINLVAQDLLERDRSLDLVVLHRNASSRGQDAVFSKEPDQVGKADPRAPHEGPDGTLQLSEESFAAKRFVDDVGVARGQADQIADRRHT